MHTSLMWKQGLHRTDPLKSTLRALSENIVETESPPRLSWAVKMLLQTPCNCNVLIKPKIRLIWVDLSKRSLQAPCLVTWKQRVHTELNCQRAHCSRESTQNWTAKKLTAAESQHRNELPKNSLQQRVHTAELNCQRTHCSRESTQNWTAKELTAAESPHRTELPKSSLQATCIATWK